MTADRSLARLRYADSAPGGGYALIGAGGTSASAPFRGGLIALADQEAGHPNARVLIPLLARDATRRSG